jgi:nucleotide-binding universal stress UspA family protein
MTGTVFDLPLLADDARRYLADAGLELRTDFEGGDFFQEVPAGADAYLLKYILHDWDDDQAVRILQSCRQAAGADGAVLVFEHVIPERVEDSSADRFVVGMDLIMMGYGGRERTLREYAALFERAGLTLHQATPGPTSGFSLLEGLAARTGPEAVPARERDAETIGRETT